VIIRIQVGAFSSAQVTKTTQATPKKAINGLSTRCWPYLSARRATCGAETAYPIEPAPETRPASP
jgi:hypothetical protein